MKGGVLRGSSNLCSKPLSLSNTTITRALLSYARSATLSYMLLLKLTTHNIMRRYRAREETEWTMPRTAC